MQEIHRCRENAEYNACMLYTHAHNHKRTRTRYRRVFVSVSLVALLFSALLQVGSRVAIHRISDSNKLPSESL